MNRYSVIGTHVSNSLSPPIYKMLFERYGIDAVYGTAQIGVDGLEDFVSSARNSLAGFNVTMPFKRMILPMLNKRDESAVRCDSCNTVIVREGELTGYSTDSDGFIRALYAFDVEPAGRRTLLLGAGGAAFAVGLGILDAGAQSLTILNRDEGNAHALAKLLNERTGKQVTVCPLTRDSLNENAVKADLFVNTTALGMSGHEEFESFEFLSGFRGVVNDIVYIPQKTRLLESAARLGIKTVPGLPMLICQALIAFELYAGEKTGEDDFRAVYERLSEIDE